VEGEDEWLVIVEDGEISCLQHVPKVPYSLIYIQELSVVSAVLLLAGFSFLEKKARGCQASCTRRCMLGKIAVVEASLTRARGAVKS
jgi:hypothetical protein